MTIILFCNCHDFLEPSSQDKVVPKSIEQLEELLLGEVIKSTYDPLRYLPFMTDDIDDRIPSGKLQYEYRHKLWGYYTWQENPEITKDNNYFEDQAWQMYYHKIFTCNIILDEIPSMQGKDDAKIKLKAETLFLRAMHYFLLVNLYGEPYENGEQAKTALGVPINNEVTILNNRYTRESVYDVYKKINEDLLKSISLFKKVEINTSKARPNIKAAYLLASRVSLYKKEYEESKLYADTLLNMDVSLLDLCNTKIRYFINYDNPEMLFSFGVTSIDREIKGGRTDGYYRVSAELLGKYGKNDSRMTKKKFFYNYNQKPYKFFYKCISFGKALRTSEAYLNRAEALYYLKKYDEAIADLYKLRQNRIKGDYEIKVDTPEDILEAIRLERRLEFCFEYHRWFDLRRYGRPELTHKISSKNGDVVYKLEKGSSSYTLPIPMSVINLNNELKRIKRQEQLNQEEINEN